MSLQRSRRHDPYPWTWELPLGATVAVTMVLVLAAHGGRAVANHLAGQPWRFPPRTELFTSLPALLRGDATAGLRAPPGPLPGPGTAETVAATGPLWTCIGAAEVGALVLMGLLSWQALARWGPGRLKGMASTADVERMLGRSRLRANRAVIRPDLFGRHQRTPTARHPASVPSSVPASVPTAAPPAAAPAGSGRRR